MSIACYSKAANQYASRPSDESFPTMAAMIAAADHERQRSAERTYNLKDMHVTAADIIAADSNLSARVPVLVSPTGKSARFSHWSFQQFCSMLGQNAPSIGRAIPAWYLRTLPAEQSAAALNHAIADTNAGTRAVVLASARGGENDQHVLARSITSESYGRLWDSQFYSAADKMVFQHASSTGDQWIAPPTWKGDAAGTWRGDRDSFVIRVDGGSIVNDPTVRGGKDGRLYRGILLRNSEVGAATVTIEWILFEYICGNLNLWGAIIDRKFTRRHIGVNVLGDTTRELATLARQWAERSASKDEAIIRTLADFELAKTEAGVVDELRKVGYTVEQAKAAMSTCAQQFDASPFSVWGIAQGTTRNSQDSAYQDDRYELDKLAAALTSRALRAKVAA